ncbi:hypothetical protein [Actinoplanes teichomyceticus]|uniref:Uncharacterized protein n=1 Tax=Actinoplanes teichomyceticus TaxID=1867 RepID=A0A561W9Y0_ACTTI|nr:hypothetical protein [Actinoplanes teichomyceticus]TWG20674.1 hypothetical protein FHX34_103203 [Actinoplanes teichomyceticus]GIF14329.1 hypothetical protein Ate01nite_43610 [Actinoplanes teichomyceticus]
MPGSARTITGGSVIVYLAVGLRSRLRAHAAETGRSHTQIVFDALNDAHPRLAELTGGPPGGTARDGLFVAQRSGRRHHGEDRVQVSIRPNPANLAVIDGLAGRHTAGNRSALIAAALDAYLPDPMKGLAG